MNASVIIALLIIVSTVSYFVGSFQKHEKIRSLTYRVGYDSGKQNGYTNGFIAGSEAHEKTMANYQRITKPKPPSRQQNMELRPNYFPKLAVGSTSTPQYKLISKNEAIWIYSWKIDFTSHITGKVNITCEYYDKEDFLLHYDIDYYKPVTEWKSYKFTGNSIMPPDVGQKVHKIDVKIVRNN